tara:strand:- start:1508 stop:2170 length:663 start_codon:yes stop_codon:yes gene_type:complete
MLIYCLVPARKGSKRIKNKNLILIKNNYLINFTIKTALNTKLIDKVFVSTNDKRIEKILLKNVNIIKRPENISRDTSSTEECISHFISYLSTNKIKTPDAIVLLQCTSPYRGKNDINLAIKNFKKNRLDSLFSACRNKNLFWMLNKDKLLPLNYTPSKRLREQEMKEQFIENGSIYIFKTKEFKKHKCRLFGKIGIHVMKKENSFQIDTAEDIKLIKKLK